MEYSQERENRIFTGEIIIAVSSYRFNIKSSASPPHYARHKLNMLRVVSSGKGGNYLEEYFTQGYEELTHR